MSRPLLALALLGSAVLLACPKSSPSGSSDDGSHVPGGVVDPGSDPISNPGSDPSQAAGSTSSSPASDGSCLSAADCDGGVCEGQGCGPDQPGECMPTDRMCTRDSQPYCGCDGQTFRASGSCPGQRYAHRGACEPAEPGTAPDGASCLAGSDCRSGVCEGQGCGPDQPGECKPTARPCTRDLQPYCGCDGQTFRSSGSCPGQRYAARGECGSTPPA